MPPNTPSAPKNIPSSPNLANNPGGFESKESGFGVNPQRAQAVRQATSTVISTRSEFVKFLRSNGLGLLTSAVEFQRTGDFVLSSFVIYPQQGDFKEPLKDFVHRYPDLQEGVNRINESLRPIQSQMAISS